MLYRGNAPVGYTCPDIDEVITELQQIEEYVCKLYDGKQSLLERLRSSNEKLREWGESLHERVEELEKEVEELKQQLEA